MIDMQQISAQRLHTEPFNWAAIDHLFTPDDAASLASTYPHDKFKTVVGNDGEKKYKYEARALIAMGADTTSHPEDLSPAWLELAADLHSPAYRAAMSDLTGYDLTRLPVEANIFHYGPGASLGPHLDLASKLVTHVLYFNPSWDAKDGGCLTILRSSDRSDIAAEVLPIVGSSAVIVRSDRSWHAVSHVVESCAWSRRSLTLTFYSPGSPSTMWPPKDKARLHRYDVADM
jgi:SM-20-related protein